MARTLSQILTDVNAYLDLEAAEPTGTELDTRKNYANQTLFDVAALAQFSEFHTIYNVYPSANASVSLPSNFHELMSPPRQYQGGSWVEFEEIKPLDRFSKSTGDNYVYIMGNPMEGYTAVFNGLDANATLSFDFQRFPSGMATLTDICELSDPMVVVADVEAKVLESRSDDRFPIKRADANQRIQSLIGRESKTPGGGFNTTRRQGASAYSIGG